MTIPKRMMVHEAIALAKKNYRIFPIFEVRSDGLCSCGRKKCNRIGKHPRTKNGFRDATIDTNVISKWFKRWPSANIAIATGNGLVVIDVDSHCGGEETMAALELTHGKLTPTLMVETGGGGYHLYYRTSATIQSSVGRLGPGIDVRAEGGYVVAPPSNHASGNHYIWADHTHDNPQLMPAFLIPLCNQSNLKVIQGGQSKINSGERNSTLTSIAGTMRKRGLEEASLLAALLVHNRTHCQPPLPDHEVKAIAKSIGKKPMGQMVNPANRSWATQPWAQQLRIDTNRNVTKDLGNATLFLTHHDSWQAVLAWDLFNNKVLWNKPAPTIDGLTLPAVHTHIQDADLVYIHHWLTLHAASFAVTTLPRAVELAAKANPVHPVRQYLAALKHDGVKRLDTWLSTYLGAKDTAYTRSVARWWLLSAVARVFRPGCQADHILVLEGPQGAAKSTSMEILASTPWFLGSLPDISNKDSMAALAGKWIIEIAELQAFRKAETTKIKDFLSQRNDEYRPSYGRYPIVQPRQCVFVGTTNDDSYLKDPTGARRFWPVTVGKIDREALARDRDQLWAEATKAFHAGQQWWPEGAIVSTITEEQDKRYDVDEWESVIAQWLQGKKQVTQTDCLQLALGIEPGKWKRYDMMRVANVLKRLGYSKHRMMLNGIRQFVYTLPSK